MPTAATIASTSSPTPIPASTDTAASTTSTPAPTPTPLAGDLVVSVPSPVDPGQEVGFAAPMDGGAGVEIIYEWAHPPGMGKILDGQGTNAITYQTPTEPGTYKIELTIRFADAVLTRNAFVTVREKSDVAPTSLSSCDSYRPTLRGASELPGEVEIKTPENCTIEMPTGKSVTVAGTYTGMPADMEIWVLVYPNTSPFYWPQAIDACKGVYTNQGDGKWQGQFSLGGKDGTPEWFDIIVVFADQKASEFFRNWYKSGCEAGVYPGIPAADIKELNVVEKGYVTVQSLD